MKIPFCKPGPYSALHLRNEIIFDCFARHFFLFLSSFGICQREMFHQRKREHNQTIMEI